MMSFEHAAAEALDHAAVGPVFCDFDQASLVQCPQETGGICKELFDMSLTLSPVDGAM